MEKLDKRLKRVVINKNTITKEQLLEFGMTETKGDNKFMYPMEKVISIPNDDNDGQLIIGITKIRNYTELCLILPDGDLIFLSINNIEDLKTFEKCIGSYEPNY